MTEILEVPKILELVDHEKVESLEEVLACESDISNGNDPITDGEDIPDIFFRGDMFPELVYNISISGGNFDITRGTAKIFNPDGFFFASFHGYDPDYNVLFMYNPITGCITQPKILMTWEIYDVSMGILPVHANLEYKTIPISDVSSPKGTGFILSYNISKADSQKIVVEIMSKCQSYSDGNSAIDYQQTERLVENLGDLGATITTGLIPETYGGMETDESEGQYLIAASGLPLEGDSSCPVFDVNGHLIGIVVSSHKDIKDATYCVQPRILRDMVNHYVNAVKAHKG